MTSVEKHLHDMSAPHIENITDNNTDVSNAKNINEFGENHSDNDSAHSKTSTEGHQNLDYNVGVNSQSGLLTGDQEDGLRHSLVETDKATSAKHNTFSDLSQKDSPNSNYSQDFSTSNNTEELSNSCHTNSNLQTTTTGSDDECSNFSQKLEATQLENMAQIDATSGFYNDYQENSITENKSKCERISVNSLENEMNNVCIDNKQICNEPEKTDAINEKIQNHDSMSSSKSQQDFSDMNCFSESFTDYHNTIENDSNSEKVNIETNDQLSNEEKEKRNAENMLHSKEVVDNDYKYQVSCARFEYGTPTEHSSFERDSQEVDPEENEDLNFVPGIHKTNPWSGSHSGSFSSLTGSGSFNAQSRAEEKGRSSTMDSKSSIGKIMINDRLSV